MLTSRPTRTLTPSSSESAASAPTPSPSAPNSALQCSTGGHLYYQTVGQKYKIKEKYNKHLPYEFYVIIFSS